MKKNVAQKWGIIGIHQLRISCIVGIHPEEREKEQHLFVDAKVKVDISQSCETGQIQHTVDYVSLADLCNQLAQINHYQLLETYANDILDHCIERFHANWAWVSIQKPSAIPSAKYAFVEMERFHEEN